MNDSIDSPPLSPSDPAPLTNILERLGEILKRNHESLSSKSYNSWSHNSLDVMSNIVYKQGSSKNQKSQKDMISDIFYLTTSLEKAHISLSDFEHFLQSSHDMLIEGNSSVRASILRVIRMTIQDEEFVKVFTKEDFPFVVVTSFERDGDYAVERMQAFKLMRKLLVTAPLLYPICFARSMVAVVNFKEDGFRKYCLETLKELALVNAELVSVVNGFTCLLNAVIEPDDKDMADNILLTILFLLNDPQIRQTIQPYIDLRILFSPFTDLDTEPTELEPKLLASKAALILMMRSWVGLVLITSDDMGLPTLVGMLKDTKVPLATRTVILEIIDEVFAPCVSKRKVSKEFSPHGRSADSGYEGGTPESRSRSVTSSSGDSQSSTPKVMSGTTSTNTQLNTGTKGTNINSNSNKNNRPRSGSSGIIDQGLIPYDEQLNAPFSNPMNARANEPPPRPVRHRSFTERLFTKDDGDMGRSSGSISSRSSIAGNTITTSSSSSSSSSSSRKMAGFLSPNKEPSRRGSGYSSFNFSSIFRKQDSAQLGLKKDKQNPIELPGLVSSQTGVGLAGGIGGVVGKNSQGLVPTLKTNETTRTAGNQASSDKSDKDTPVQKSLSFENTDSIRTMPSKASQAGPLGDGGPKEDDSNTIFDPIFNLMDNYTALLCCSFLHVDLIQSLYFLGTTGVTSLATKSRSLMVAYLRIVARIFPESRCSDLLTIPSLIEFASIKSGELHTSRAHKSSQILISLADAFSLMPSKQVSGNHISGLSSAPFGGINGSQGAGTPSSGEPAKSRGRRLSGASTMTGGHTPISNNGTNTSSHGRSNFSRLNIQTVLELAEEIKISSFSSISGLGGLVDVSMARGTTLDVVKSLRMSLMPAIDKADFTKQMDMSKVIGKDGKEPFKWDWVAIGDMLEYSFQHQDRLSEALKTKWVRRVCGFYRCSTEEKGYFANLDWEPTNLQYLECACNMYSVLLKDELGLSFLNSDRRGMLFSEITSEIEQLSSTAASQTRGHYSMSLTSASLSALSKNVFRLFSCNTTMAREFFTLLGRIIRTSGSRHLLDGTMIFQHLSNIGRFQTLDYLSRLTFTSLSFSDGGFMSRHLLQIWTTQANCSAELRTYFHTLLRVLLTCRPVDSYNWCVDSIINQLGADEIPSSTLLKALEELIHNKEYLRIVINKRPKILQDPNAQQLLLRFLSIPEGIRYLDDNDWLESAMTEWKETKCRDYLISTEEKISVVFSTLYQKSESLHGTAVHKNVTPIVIQTPELLNMAFSRENAAFSSSSTSSTSTSTGSTVSPPSASDSPPPGAEDNTQNYDPNIDLVVGGMHGLLRVPWHMEVKQVLHTATNTPHHTTTNAPANASDYLKVDTFLDASELASPFCFETTFDAARIIKVRGVILNSSGEPHGHPVPHNRTISATLLAGICPIFRNGKVQCYVDAPNRKRSATQSSTGSGGSAGSGGAGVRESISQTASAVTGGARASLSLAHPGGTRSSITGNLIETLQEDIAITLGQENLYDWSHCRPGSRQANSTGVTDLGDGTFSVTVPREPVTWIFSRDNPAASVGPRDTLDNDNHFRATFSRSEHSGGLYLIEVQYYFSMDTGQAVFVPMPRHIYGELARSVVGCEYLVQKNIISELITSVHQKLTTRTNEEEVRAALWSLGHIASTEPGYFFVTRVDPIFVEWCIDNVTSNPNYSLRGTFFYVLGLLSRTTRGANKLSRLKWESASWDGHSAVATPRDPSVLFPPLAPTKNINNLTLKMKSFRPKTKLVPFLLNPDLETEVLNLIAKLPGVIVYKECKMRLEQIKAENKELFNSRALYIQVNHMLNSYTFKLTARREVINLFGIEAKKKGGGGAVAVL